MLSTPCTALSLTSPSLLTSFAIVLIAGVVAVILNLIIPPEQEPDSNIVEHPEAADPEAQHDRDSASIDETKKERPVDARGTVE